MDNPGSKSILNPSFRYTPSAATDISKTFARERKRIREQEASQKANAAEAQRVVTNIKVKS